MRLEAALRGGIAALAVACLAPLYADQAAELDVGDVAPDFQSLDDSGALWKSSEHVGDKILVVYFFPAAMTGG